MKKKEAPFPSALFSAHIVPPWASTILFEINNPNPVPWNDFEANLVNSLGIMSRSIPFPVSFMQRRASLLSLKPDEIDILPSCVNFLAFYRTLKMTCVTLVLSASTKTSLGSYIIFNFSSDVLLPRCSFIVISFIQFTITSFKLNCSLFRFSE